MKTYFPLAVNQKKKASLSSGGMSTHFCGRRRPLSGAVSIYRMEHTHAHVHPGLCHRTGMPSDDKGEQTALNESGTTLACFSIAKTLQAGGVNNGRLSADRVCSQRASAG